jgi:hypothetical protein
MTWLYAFFGELKFESDGFVNSSSLFSDLLERNAQWALDGYDVISNTVFAELTPDAPMRIETFTFELFLSRNPVYYIISILLPCMLISLVATFAFCLPVESGERVSFGITVLLSFSLLLVMVNDVTPKGGAKIPLLSEYALLQQHIYLVRLIYSLLLHPVYGSERSGAGCNVLLAECAPPSVWRRRPSLGAPTNPAPSAAHPGQERRGRVGQLLGIRGTENRQSGFSCFLHHLLDRHHFLIRLPADVPEQGGRVSQQSPNSATHYT